MTRLAPIATLNDNGAGVGDIAGALAAATEVNNDFLNDNNTMLFVHNGSAGSITCTLKSQTDPYGRGGNADTNNDEVLTIAAGKTGFYPFLNMASWNSGGLAQFVLSAFTDVKIGIYRIRKNR